MIRDEPLGRFAEVDWLYEYLFQHVAVHTSIAVTTTPVLLLPSGWQLDV